MVAKRRAGRGLLPARAIVGVRLKGVAKESTRCQPAVPMVAKRKAAKADLLPARAIVVVRLKGVAKESTRCQPAVPMVANQGVIVH
jgi:hypothetical protein